MNNSTHVPLIDVTRGKIVESIHYGSAVVVDREGKTLWSIGNIQSSFYLRSSAKPFQALAFLERGGSEYYHLTLKEIAILCASHSGTEDHIRTLQELQKKIGICESDLQCGIHPPLDRVAAEQIIQQGAKPTSNHHNCSGKHTGMLAFAKMLGAPLDKYLEQSHPVQKAIFQTFSEMCEFPLDELQMGIDGCSAPVFALPLKNAALGFARLSDPTGLPNSRAEACRLIFHAMTAHPNMVAGPGFFDTVFIQTMQGSMLAKSGAEGVLALGIRPNMLQSDSLAYGIVIKISDGDNSHRAAPLVALTLLKKLGGFEPDQLNQLSNFDNRSVQNWRGSTVGDIHPSAEFLSL